MCACYHAVGLYVWPLQGDGDTVEEDEEEDDVVEHLVTYDLLTPYPEPEEKTQRAFFKKAEIATKKKAFLPHHLHLLCSVYTSSVSADSQPD